MSPSRALPGRTLTRCWSSILLCAALAGCNKKDENKVHATGSAVASAAAEQREAVTAAPRPATVTDDHVAIVEGIVTAYNKLQTTMAAARIDCKKAGEAQGEINAGLHRLDKLGTDAAFEEWYETNYIPKFAGLDGLLINVSQTCAADPAFRDALMKGDHGM